MSADFITIGQWVEARKCEIIRDAAETAEAEAAGLWGMDTGAIWDALDEYDDWKKELN